jgi:hypothetical protein
MTIQEFLYEKTLSHIEIYENLIINLVVDNDIYGLSVDTSHLESLLVLERTDNFIIDGNLLICNNITVDMTEISML